MKSMWQLRREFHQSIAYSIKRAEKLGLMKTAQRLYCVDLEIGPEIEEIERGLDEQRTDCCV